MTRDSGLKILKTAVATIAVAAAMAFFLVLLFQFKPEQPLTKLDKGWAVSFEKIKAKNVSIAEIHEMTHDELKKGSKLTLSLTLPEEVAMYHSPTIRENSYYNGLEVFLDGKRIFSDSMDKLKKGEYIGKVDGYIELSEAEPGQELRLEYHMSENDVDPDISVPELGNYIDLQGTILNRNMYPLFSGIFLVMFGLFLIIISLVLRPVLPEVAGQISSSILCMVFGLYILTSNRLSTIFFDTGRTADVEFVCFTLIAPLMYLLLYQIHEIRRKAAFNACFLITVVLSAALIILHFTGIMHAPDTKHVYYGVLLVMTFVLIWCGIEDIKNKKIDADHVLQMMGPGIFCVESMIAVTYSIVSEEAFRQRGDEQIITYIITAGCLAFALSRLLVYFIFLSETDQRRKEFVALTHRAYHDPVTDAFNENYYKESLEKLDRRARGFAVMSVKLEGLDDITYQGGHAKSDSWLRKFGEILKMNTPDDGTAFRIGYDKFALIVQGGKKGKLEHIEENFGRAMKLLDYNEPEISHVLSCGIAYSDEKKNAGSEEIVSLAEERREEDARS